MICAVLGLLPVVPAQSVEFKNPPELSKPNGYSQVAIMNHGRLVFVAGQVGMDKDGKMPTTSPRRQSRRLRISKWRLRPRAPSLPI
jgi:enamine deaminase RidA (YjgF/YER057c/UK114 family)